MLLARGLSNAQIAETLVVAKGTVDTHVPHPEKAGLLLARPGGRLGGLARPARGDGLGEETPRSDPQASRETRRSMHLPAAPARPVWPLPTGAHVVPPREQNAKEASNDVHPLSRPSWKRRRRSGRSSGSTPTRGSANGAYPGGRGCAGEARTPRGLCAPTSLSSLEADPVTIARVGKLARGFDTPLGGAMKVTANDVAWWVARLPDAGAEEIYAEARAGPMATAFHPPMKAIEVGGVPSADRVRWPATATRPAGCYNFTALVMDGDQPKQIDGAPQVIGPTSAGRSADHATPGTSWGCGAKRQQRRDGGRRLRPDPTHLQGCPRVPSGAALRRPVVPSASDGREPHALGTGRTGDGAGGDRRGARARGAQDPVRLYHTAARAGLGAGEARPG